ncbi:MAG: polyribonucleotide nucleotidyltransferase [Kosmotogales bacterium]|nr:polyribonucleotide nucleotidyltransferase [Kosmotogales bacterium]
MGLNYNVWEKDFFGKTLRIEQGKMAKQAGGSCLVKYGESVILCTVDGNENPIDGDFMPLTVEYSEKFYAAGKIPGGFNKREGRPSVEAILSSRLIDRPLRPLFPEGMRNEINVIVTVLSADPDCYPDTLGIFGSSFALNISRIPFEGIVAGVRICRKNDEFIVFPSEKDLEDCDLDIVVAGTKDAVTMVEGEAKEVSEKVMVDAIETAHNAIKELVSFQKEMISSFNVEKFEIEIPEAPEGFVEGFEKLIDPEKILENMDVPGKKAKDKALKEYRDELIEKYREEASEKFDEEEFDNNLSFIKNFYHDKEKELMRKRIIEQDKRMDGRKSTEIRPITCEVDILPRTHGSALFTRGETQSLGIVTLGTPDDEQIIDTLFEDKKSTFMLHYNFPPFSTGEVKRLRGPGRREIGHGHLAERAIKAMMPSVEEFPYTVRIVSEILESNGSSSMATVCSGTLSLMAAGVPLKKPVAGVAMGLIQEPDGTVVLTDILGNEDHMGDMDFKVTGTKDGITAFQMDVKISGVTEEIMIKAMQQAKEARLSILEKMTDTIEKPRESVGKYAPVVTLVDIPNDKIGELIGSGGKVIKKLTSEYDADIFIDDEKNQVKIISNNPEKAEKLLKIVNIIANGPEYGKKYIGKISRIEKYGFFVDVAPGVVGMIHSSKTGEDFKTFMKKYDLNSEIDVVITGKDNMGRIQMKLFGVEDNGDDENNKRRTYNRNNDKRDYKRRNGGPKKS